MFTTKILETGECILPFLEGFLPFEWVSFIALNCKHAYLVCHKLLVIWLPKDKHKEGHVLASLCYKRSRGSDHPTSHTIYPQVLSFPPSVRFSVAKWTFLIFPASHPSNKMLFYRSSHFIYSYAVSCFTLACHFLAPKQIFSLDRKETLLTDHMKQQMLWRNMGKMQCHLCCISS